VEEMGLRLPVVREAAALELRHKDLHTLVDASQIIVDDLRDLAAFAVTNVRTGLFIKLFAKSPQHLKTEGFRKIIKKLDKHLHTDHSAQAMANIKLFSFAHIDTAIGPALKIAQKYQQELVSGGRANLLRS